MGKMHIDGQAMAMLFALALVLIWVHLPQHDRSQVLDVVKLTAELVKQH